MLIRKLNGLFTGRGFAEKKGRHPQIADADFHRGPVDIAVGPAGEILAIGKNLTVGSEQQILNGYGHIALPAFVDSHTHALFAGQRAREFYLRWAGKSYLQIAQEGGGIAGTVAATIGCPDEILEDALCQRLSRMQERGAAVIEVKSGYAASSAEELRLLRIIRKAALRISQGRVISTFLGLHALPANRHEDEYCAEMIAILPLVKKEGLADYVDCFPERGFFSLTAALRFADAAASLGFKLKAHADEITFTGASEAFIQRNAVSVDHLQQISTLATEMLGVSETVAALLPATSFFLGLPYAPARALIDRGAKVALATDYNPGTAPALSLGFTALLAASQLHMTAPEILCALTYNGSSALGLQSEHGILAPGFKGEFLLAPADAPARFSALEWLEEFLLEKSGTLSRLPIKLQNSPGS